MEERLKNLEEKIQEIEQFIEQTKQQQISLPLDQASVLVVAKALQDAGYSL